MTKHLAPLASRRGRFLSVATLASILAGLALGLSAAAPQPQIEVEQGHAIAKRLVELRPGLPIQSVTASPVKGLVAVNLADGSTFYGTHDGRYLFSGDLFELGATDLINLTEANRAVGRKTLLAQVASKDTVTFSPVSKPKAAVYVFTDVDCGYCRKLHQEVPALNAKGIEVHYLAYPRAGVGSPSYDKIVSAWCAADRQTALTELKAGKNIKAQTCANPVEDQYALGRQMGISGTPAIVFEDGTLLPGYMPADELAAAMGI